MGPHVSEDGHTGRLRILAGVAPSCLLAVLLLSGLGPRYSPRRLHLPTTTEFHKAFPGDAQNILEHGESFVLLSLDPDANPTSDTREVFHDYVVLGRTTITDAATRARLIGYLYDGMDNVRGAAGCFSPRHGIHASRGSESVDAVICFHCGTFGVYYGDHQARSYALRSTQPVFDAVLRQAGVPLPRQ